MVFTGLVCYDGFWGNEKTKRERDTGLLLEETHDKQLNESGRLESVYLWSNYTSKKISPKRWRLRTKGPVMQRTCRRDWMAKETRTMALGQKVLPRLCAGNRTEQLKHVPSEPETQALLAVTGSVDPILSSLWITDWFCWGVTYPDLHFTKRSSWLFPENTLDQRGEQEVLWFFLPVALDYCSYPGSRWQGTELGSKR